MPWPKKTEDWKKLGIDWSWMQVESRQGWVCFFGSIPTTAVFKLGWINVFSQREALITLPAQSAKLALGNQFLAYILTWILHWMQSSLMYLLRLLMFLGVSQGIALKEGSEACLPLIKMMLIKGHWLERKSVRLHGICLSHSSKGLQIQAPCFGMNSFASTGLPE